MILRVLFVLILAAGFLAAGFWLDYQRFLETPLQLEETPAVIEVPRGASIRQVAKALTAKGAIQHPYYFVALAMRRGDAARIKAGEFELRQGMGPAELLDAIVAGKVIQYPITLVEGWTFRQAVDTVAKDGRFHGDIGSLSDEALMERLGRPGELPEGRLFPDTYSFPRRTAALDVLRRALERMEQVLAEEWESRAEGLPIETPYQALILASIVEKETAVPSERPDIAGVFVRRLEKGMKLQTDPTVIYGMGARYDGNIRRTDLNEATPYNTYVIDGLPPTPIALPGREAIHAVLHPAEGDSLYFVARGDGSHQFSATLDEHNRAVRRYQLGRP
jgi:UPF0755 protein